MLNLLESIQLFFPLLAALILLFGFILKRKNYFVVALWLSLIALILHYRDSGGEILGSYFNYYHTAIYSLNLIVLISSLIYLFISSINEIQNNKILRYSVGFISALLITGGILLEVNLWINASFIENRMTNTPVLQVATFNKQPYCEYKYVFYKVGTDKVVWFMCPNHYGLIPSVGQLHTAPNFVVKQLPTQLQRIFEDYAKEL